MKLHDTINVLICGYLSKDAAEEDYNAVLNCGGRLQGAAVIPNSHFEAAADPAAAISKRSTTAPRRNCRMILLLCSPYTGGPSVVVAHSAPGGI